MEFRDRHGCRELPVGAVGGTTMTGIQIKAARQSQLLRNSGFKELLHLLLHCCICGYPCFIPPALYLSKDRVPPGTSLGTWIVSGLDTRLGTQNSGSWNEPGTETQVSWGRSNPSAACSPPQPLEDSAAPAEVSWEMASCGWSLFPRRRVAEVLWMHRSSQVLMLCEGFWLPPPPITFRDLQKANREKCSTEQGSEHTHLNRHLQICFEIKADINMNIFMFTKASETL